MRWLREPIFILSAVRSGSTLLRAILGAHSALYAPHELHLKDITVSLDSSFARLSMDELGVTAGELEYLLWDRAPNGTIWALANPRDRLLDLLLRSPPVLRKAVWALPDVGSLVSSAIAVLDVSASCWVSGQGRTSLPAPTCRRGDRPEQEW